jgi:hypothetical protein
MMADVSSENAGHLAVRSVSVPQGRRRGSRPRGPPTDIDCAGRMSSVRMRGSSVGWLAALGALGYGTTVPALQAQGYVATPPWVICAGASQANMAVLEGSLSPASNAFVQAGAPVTFSGNSEVPVTFTVASSPTLLSSPDIDSGLGSLQPGTSSYSFTTAKATATPGILIYWDASFSSATVKGCEGLTPSTYTTSVRTFTVVSPPPTEAEVATKKNQEEEAAAKKKREEEAAAGTGSVLFVWSAGTGIKVQSGGATVFKVTCKGTATCSGTLTLTVKTKGKGNKQQSKTMTIATATFSIPPGTLATIELKLNTTGRALLSANHGRLNAILTVLKSSPGPAQTHTESARLVQHKVHGERKK